MSKILLVEDNPLYRQAGQSYLQSRNHSVDLAVDLIEGIARINMQNYSGVVTDCFFPEITGSGKREQGYEAVRMLREADAGRRKSSPNSGAICKVGDILGVFAAKFFAKNAKVDYKQGVDLYWALEQAIKEDEAKQPLGILVADEASRMGIPLVLATSTNHHDELTQPIQDYASMRGWTLIDCGQNCEQQKETPEFWQKVTESLERKMGK